MLALSTALIADTDERASLPPGSVCRTNTLVADPLQTPRSSTTLPRPEIVPWRPRTMHSWLT